MNHLFNDDILYHVLQHAVESNRNEALTHRAQREALYTYALVSRIWSRIAQSLLFRHVFLQIRTAMLAFLEVVNHNTQRGRRLASYVQVATIKLSRAKESFDPLSLPMIHTRHLPALLAHLPSLHELRLRMGEQSFVEKELSSMRRLSSIRVLTLSNAGPGYQQALEIPKIVDTWSGLQSLILEARSDPPGTLPLPSFTLREFHEPTNFGYTPPETIKWILKCSVGILEHCTFSAMPFVGDLRTAISEHFSTIQSLTLGHVQWDEELCNALCSFANLIELRIVQIIVLMGPRFPGKLPNTLQHLTFVVPAYKEPLSPHRDIEFKTTIPTQLKSYATIIHKTDYRPENLMYEPFATWVKEYEQACRHMGVDVRPNFLRVSNPYGGELAFLELSKSCNAYRSTQWPRSH